ncbi:peptide/nickel transport system substrate-binding protein [Virgibacillus natechei]|uniref:Peptide/nickel transport system substrate-binding protein n=1 Tax=Virgibacillus natechei TaxID=1216297 RepID=A0ABS4IK66_9BACI|nr:glutathione ABC transporter substrate-binding protein [Virgibacillus natechei]MBP1970955.1 peptide/nickel transport system substrate-binding protein [Virgibacillus natechei]UZD12723.1 glutathione ABC transporter substrate-binding protein [Virgibacillus natechei]
MKMSKNSLLLIAIMVMLSIVLMACASEPDENGSTDDNGEEATDGGDAGEDDAAGEGGDLVIANQSDVVSLDPAGSNDVPSSDVQANIYETLVKQDMDMELQPSLAESWEAVEDDVWEFDLQEGVTFHDGSEFNAEVVKANIERIMDPDVASPRAFLYEMVTDIEVVDDYTVQFTTEYPFSPLPAHLAHSGGAMVALEQVEADYEAMEEGEEPGSVINQNPIGTGYFEFDEWNAGEYVRLTNNEDYWDGQALLDTVTFKVVGEDLTRVAEITTGDTHIANPLSPSDIGQIEAEDGAHVHDQGSVSLSYIGFNMEKEPFDDERVRQAVSMAIDKDQIIDGIYDGVGIPAIGPIPPDVFGYDDSVSGIEHNLEEAEDLLAEAGYEDGFSTTLWTNDQRERIDAATNVQAQLEEIGIEVEVEILEWGAYLDQTANGEHDMFVLGWSTATGDADYSMHPLFHSDNVGEPGNRTFTENDELDALLEEGRQAADPEDREEIYSEAQELLVDIAPMLYLHHQEFLLSVRDEVKGFELLPTQILQLKDVYIEE